MQLLEIPETQKAIMMGVLDHRCPCEEEEGDSEGEEEALDQWDQWAQWGQWVRWVQEDQVDQVLVAHVLEAEEGQDSDPLHQDLGALRHLGPVDQGLVHGGHHLPLILIGDLCLLHLQAWVAPWALQACLRWDQWVQWGPWDHQVRGDQWGHLGQVVHLTNSPIKIKTH